MEGLDSGARQDLTEATAVTRQLMISSTVFHVSLSVQKNVRGKLILETIN